MTSNFNKIPGNYLVRDGEDDLPSWLRQCTVCEAIKPLAWYKNKKDICSKCTRRQERKKEMI